MFFSDIGLIPSSIALEHLINDLYELALSDTGNLTINKSPTMAHEFFSSFFEENAHRASTKNLSLELHSKIDSNETINIDALKITQVLHNIFNNSLNYTDAPGKILWELYAEEKYLVLSAEDSAPGAKEAEIEKIFDRLYRIEKSRNRALGGAGLGLPLSRNIALAHGGTLSAEQSPLGGLKLILRLPRSFE
jgi:two-component system sensor histidine kinase BaeS